MFSNEWQWWPSIILNSLIRMSTINKQNKTQQHKHNMPKQGIWKTPQIPYQLDSLTYIKDMLPMLLLPVMTHVFWGTTFLNLKKLRNRYTKKVHLYGKPTFTHVDFLWSGWFWFTFWLLNLFSNYNDHTRYTWSGSLGLLSRGDTYADCCFWLKINNHYTGLDSKASDN